MAVTFGPLDFLAKVVPLIPRPRLNQIRYFGLFAPRSKLRAQIIPQAQADELTPASQQLDLFPPASATDSRAGARGEPNHDSPTARRNRYTRAQLLARIFEVDVECCPRCGHRPLRLVAVVTDPYAISKLLESVGGQTTASHLPSPAAGPRAPPQLELAFGLGYRGHTEDTEQPAA